MTTRRSASSATDEAPIVHHYAFVLIFEAVLLLGLAWLAARYR
jgi:hypothetical protein